MNNDAISLDKKNLEQSISMLRTVMGMSSKNLRYLEEHRNSLKSYLEFIIKSEDYNRLVQANIILQRNTSFFESILSMPGGSFIIRPIISIAEQINEKVEKNSHADASPELRIQLKTANWSLPFPITGKVYPMNTYITRSSFENELTRIRKEYFGKIIFLLDGKAPVSLLANWPDPMAVIVAGQGGDTSECLNFAKMYKIPYINGAWDYFNELKKYFGKVIMIEP